MSVETLVLPCKLSDVWRYPYFTEALHPAIIQEVDPSREIYSMNKVKNPFTYSLNLSSPPVGAQCGNPLRTHYVKSIPFNAYPMPSNQSAAASGKCGHQLPCKEIHGFV